MKTFTVAVGFIDSRRGKRMRFNVRARNEDSAWTKAFGLFCHLYPMVLTERLSVGGAVSAK